MIVNLDQVKLHYTALPKLKAQGVNEEKMYSWHNFIMGSCDARAARRAAR
jgi:hypothetical protein